MAPLGRARVLVTGGAGFIGSHLAERLLSEDAEVVVVDDMSTGSPRNLRHLSGEAGLSVYEMDAGQAPEDALEGVTHGVHLAAMTEVARSLEDPVGTVEANVLGSVRVLEAMRRAGATSAVVASSAAVYGEVPCPVAEDGAARPISPYGAGKLAVDHYAAYFAKHTPLSVSALRFFNVYGPRQHPLSPYSGVISLFTKAALTGDDIVVNGDGEQTRDFVFVEDVVEAILLALGTPGASGEVINIGTGHAVSINELASTVRELAGSSSAIRHVPPRPGDIRHSVAKVDKAKELLRFEASTSLRNGLATTLDWMRGEIGPDGRP